MPVDLPPPPPAAEIVEYEELDDFLPAMGAGNLWEYYLDPAMRRMMVDRYGTREAIVDRDLEMKGYIQDRDLGVFEDPVDIARYAANAGFRGEELVTAVAVALSESFGGMPHIVGDKGINPETGKPFLDETYGPSVGLWQIRSVLYPPDDRDQKDYVRRYEDLFDPQFNAIAAKHLYDMSKRKNANGDVDGFMEWSRYRDGDYLNYMDLARSAVQVVEDDESFWYPYAD
jgi:hypothetical protein